MKSDLSSVGNEYLKSSLNDGDILSDPFEQFGTWFEEALNSDELEPNAMILGTVDQNGQPHQRTVLLKGFSNEGFVFYTNYNSNKGRQIEVNTKVNLLFPWFQLQRQIIICGTTEKLSQNESEEYFRTRPRGSQLSAFVSNQSEKISSREDLEHKLKDAEERFAKEDVPLPESWGGYNVKPTSFEFWQGRANRLHDRFYFSLVDAAWQMSRLSP